MKLLGRTRVFLGGTTKGTAWRKEMKERLVAAGVSPEQIIDPHLPKGVPYTPDRAEIEFAQKDDPRTLMFIYVCPPVIQEGAFDGPLAEYMRDQLGSVTLLEIGEFAHSQTHRTAIVFDLEAFSKTGRSRKILQMQADYIMRKFGGNQPYFTSFAEAEAWLIKWLTASPIRMLWRRICHRLKRLFTG